MFDLINGLPVHALVVHGVVVLLPLAVIGVIAMALYRPWRLRFGWLVVGVTAVATALVPVATSSGEALEERVGDPGEHAELGDQLIYFAIPLLILTLALVVLSYRARTATVAADETGAARKSPVAVTLVAVLAVVAALATAGQTYRIGDSGARAVWGDQVSSASGE